MFVDEVLGEDQTTVVTRYGIATGNGALQLTSASFVGELPPDEMPTEVIVARTGGNIDSCGRYLHSSQFTSAEKLEAALLRERRARIALSDQIELYRQALIRKDEFIDELANLVTDLCAPWYTRIVARCRALFSRRPKA